MPPAAAVRSARVPPGGHMEPGESFAGTAVREFKEETGLLVEAISSQPAIHPADDNAIPEPVPFYVDIEREGFAIPALVQFFYVRRQAGTGGQAVEAQLEEAHGAGWFSLENLEQSPSNCSRVVVPGGMRERCRSARMLPPR
ncbi:MULTISPECIES: NUDIX domain-containing protein [unclassified Streptomyces]|uniref:NUDIX domain-containing protein n=1 Tax=Streptomyces TaxID=1883 RepID=UPI00210E5DA1|nr:MULTISPECIES: NUDIX hydrolase [unclassified Streptomyces]